VIVVSKSTQGGHVTLQPNGESAALSLDELGQALRDEPLLREQMGTEVDTSLLLVTLGPSAVPELGRFAASMTAGGYSRAMYSPPRQVSFGVPGVLRVEGGQLAKVDPIMPSPADLVSYPHVRQGGVVHGQFFPTEAFDVLSDAQNGMRYVGDARRVYYREIPDPTTDGVRVVEVLAPWKDPWLVDGHGTRGVGLRFAMATGRPHVRGDVLTLDGRDAARAIHGSRIFLAAGGRDEVLLGHCESNAVTQFRITVLQAISIGWELDERPVRLFGADQVVTVAQSGTRTVLDGGRFAEAGVVNPDASDDVT
jgi:hypothetical protein